MSTTESAIHKLIKNSKNNTNSYNYIKLLLKNGSDVNCQSIDNDNNTPLHYTILYYNVNDMNEKFVELLLENNANPNIKNNAGITPLHYAAISGNFKLMELLLKYGADPKIIDTKFCSCLYYLMEPCDVSPYADIMIKKLLSMGVDLYGNNINNSPLMALLDSYIKNPNKTKENIIYMLLEDKNININLNFEFDAVYINNYKKVIGYKTTPIHLIMKENKLNIAKKMIEYGVSLDAKSEYSNMTPFEFACVNNWPEIVDLIVKIKNKKRETEEYNIIENSSN
jgi:ankyrin repeat protein